MAGNIKGLTVEIDGNVTKLSKAIASVNTDAKRLQRELRGVTTLLDYDPKNVVLLEQKQRKLNKALEDQGVKLKELKDLEKSYSEQLGPRTEEEARDFESLQREIVATSRSLDAAKRALAEFNIEQGVSHSVLGKVGAGLESFGSRLKPVGERIQSVGSALSRTVTPAIIAAGTATVAAAVDIDTSLTNVKKTVDGTEEQYQALKQAAVDFSKTNAVKASQILDIQALGAQLGFAIDELDEFGQVVSGLDIATNMDAETAATEMAQFANITKMGHGEIRNFGSALVGLGNNFATTESDISHMAMRIAAAGKQVGLSQADILGLSTALASLGVEAEAGGTAISTIMAQIDKDVALSGEVMAGTSSMAEKDAKKVTAALETWASAAGMSAEKFAAAWKKDPVEALTALLTNMEKATAEGGNMSVMLDELGIDSIRQTDIMKRLAGNSKLVGDAVAKSNGEWEKNSALQKEVDNRNQSLAAQFEILKNRVIAIAEDVGGPLADALLDIVDQAEPLIQMIAEGAKAFSDMSGEEQRAVLQAVALSAAIGPVLSLFGRGIQQVEGFGRGMQNLARFFAETDQRTSMTARSTNEYVRNAKKAQSAAKDQAAAVKASSVAMGAAKAAAIGLALAGIALVIEKTMEYAKHQEDLKKATEGLEGALGAMDSSYLSSRDATVEAAESSDGYIKSLKEVRGEVDKVIEKQAALADSIKEGFDEAGKNVGLLDSYKRVIGELAGKSDLTAQKQGELKWAVQGVNDICGTSYEVVEDFGGAYTVVQDGAVQAKDAILELIEAQEMQIRLDAGKEAYEQAYKQQADAAAAAADATATYTQAQDDLSEAQKRVREGDQTAIETIGEYEAGVNDARRAMDEANSAYDSAKDAVSTLRDEQVLLSQAMDDGKGSVSGYVASNDFLLASLKKAGKSCSGFSETLEGVGANVTDLGKLNEEQLSRLSEDYDGTYSSISGLLDEYGVHVDESLVATQEAFDGISRSMGLFTPQVQAALFDAGMSSDDFARKLADAGVSTEDFRSLTDDQLALLVSSYNGNIDITKAKLDEFVQKNGTAGTDGASRLTGGYTSTMSANAWRAYQPGADLAAQADSGARSIDGSGAGADFAAGYAGGIRGGVYQVVAEAAAMAGSAMRAVKERQKSNSPSKEAAKLGADFGDGYANVGILGKIDDATAAGSALAQAGMDGARKKAAAISASLFSVSGIFSDRPTVPYFPGASPAYSSGFAIGGAAMHAGATNSEVTVKYEGPTPKEMAAAVVDGIERSGLANDIVLDDGTLIGKNTKRIARNIDRRSELTGRIA